MKNCYVLYIFFAIIIIIIVMSKMRNENITELFSKKVIIKNANRLPNDAKRCSLCHNCPCITKTIDMPESPFLYYGGDGEYLVKEISPYNPAYMCGGREFGNQEPNIENKKRQCWIGSKLEMSEHTPKNMTNDVNHGKYFVIHEDEQQDSSTTINHGCPLMTE